MIYSALTTRRSTYPTWILIKGDPMPVAIKRVYLGNEISESLISSRRAVVVPPMVDDIAEALTWILWDAPQPIGCSYALIIINLYDICTFGSTSMHIREAHFRLTLMAMSWIACSTFFSTARWSQIRLKLEITEPPDLVTSAKILGFEEILSMSSRTPGHGNVLLYA